MADETKSRRQLLEEAWDKTEESEDVSDTPNNEELSGEGVNAEEKADGGEVRPSEEQSGVQKTDETGKKEPEKKVDKAVQQELKAAKRIESGKPPEQKAQQLAPDDKAPVSWKPAQRELWSQIPKEARDEIRRRETEIARTLNETGVMRKFATDFANVVAPYQHLIRAQNSTPLQAVQNFMQTAAGLMQGNPMQRAQIVAEIIGNYGVDIKALDEVLSKSYNPQAAQHNAVQNGAPPPWAKPMFDFMERAQTQQQMYEAQQRQQADREIEQMAEKPFFEDLREDIADLMEIAAKRGRVLSLEEAYRKAIELDPDISKLAKRTVTPPNQQNSVSQAAATLARARRAAKTIAGAPRGEAGKSDKPKTRRELLSEAWDDKVSS